VCWQVLELKIAETWHVSIFLILGTSLLSSATPFKPPGCSIIESKHFWWCSVGTFSMVLANAELASPAYMLYWAWQSSAPACFTSKTNLGMKIILIKETLVAHPRANIRIRHDNCACWFLSQDLGIFCYIKIMVAPSNWGHITEEISWRHHHMLSPLFNQ
jgi:hypothetical protein